MKEQRQYSEQECNYSIKLGMVMGFLTGWAIGVALLLYLDSPALNQWAWVPSIPIWNAIGWMLYGMIGGSGGIFADLRFSPKIARKLHFAVKSAA
jgi:hypothetical protein